MKPIKLGLAGFGTVGAGLAQILDENRDLIVARTGRPIEIKTVVVRDPDKKRGYELRDTVTVSTDLDVLTSDPEIDIVCELMGGLETARQLMINAFAAGKHVVSANKHLLAEHGLELAEAAAKAGVGLAYEASCAGGIPIVQGLRESLAGNRIESMLGIMNGTANYILSEMTTKGLDFKTALDQAQDLGYAEADPTYDIEGHDTAHKLCVLIRLAFGRDYPLNEIPLKGITSITPTDIEFAREFGYRIKLLAHAQAVNGCIEAGVFPALVPYTYLLARVGGNYNAVRVTGNAVGPVMLHGQGAGGLPTGSAVMADIMNLARTSDCPGFTPDSTGHMNAIPPKADILPPEDAMSKYYFRFTVEDKPGVMAAIAKAMSDHQISIAQAVQKGRSEDGVSVVMLTHEARANDVEATVASIDEMSFSMQPCVNFRIL